MLAPYPDEEVERASRCHGHQQKVIASRHEFDTYPVNSTDPTPGFRWKSGVFSCLFIVVPTQSECRCEFWIGNAVLDRKNSSG